MAEDTIPTMKVLVEAHKGPIIINASDFDPAKHTKFDEDDINGQLDLDGKDGAGGSIDELDKLTVPKLKELAEAETIDLGDNTKSADIKTAIREARATKEAAAALEAGEGAEGAADGNGEGAEGEAAASEGWGDQGAADA